MSKSQIVNTIANEWGIQRDWLNQFQSQELLKMLEELRIKTGGNHFQENNCKKV